MLNTWWIVRVLFKQMNMNNKNINIFLLVVMILSSIFSISSCNNHDTHAEMAGSDEYYTCSMDPQVVENKAGNCPICHMKLIKVKKNNLRAGQIKLSAQQIKLANITYDTVAIHEFAKEITLTGKVTVDQNLSDAISARVQGRIENLAVKNIGDYVKKGQLLYEIYSEELNSLQEEYLLTFQSTTPVEGFREAAKNKLLLYGMNDSQINQLKQSKTVFQTVPVYSTIEGFVTEVSVVEGSYVPSSSTLFRFTSLQSLWVEAQVYLPYLQFLKIGTDASFSIPAASEKLFSGGVIFIAPEIQSPQRFVLARFHIISPSEQIKPGMLANITLQTEKKKALIIPVNAIIQDSKGANVWVRNNDGIYENRMVTVGMQNSRQIEITDGLDEGDVVVITGAYLLNSEYIFKKGANPMEGHQSMPGMKM